MAACSIGDSSTVSIAKALAHNKSLKTLDLSHNDISDIGAEELGVALKQNSSLKGLMLWNNRVFHTGAEAIAAGLALNKSLQWLGVRVQSAIKKWPDFPLCVYSYTRILKYVERGLLYSFEGECICIWKKKVSR